MCLRTGHGGQVGREVWRESVTVQIGKNGFEAFWSTSCAQAVQPGVCPVELRADTWTERGKQGQMQRDFSWGGRCHLRPEMPGWFHSLFSAFSELMGTG